MEVECWCCGEDFEVEFDNILELVDCPHCGKANEIDFEEDWDNVWVWAREPDTTRHN